uniref:Uncharacterized protein n=1 Tax=Micrurus spixii TaxID=129469 RepID=A0A2D4LDD0_9SAUR
MYFFGGGGVTFVQISSWLEAGPMPLPTPLSAELCFWECRDQIAKLSRLPALTHRQWLIDAQERPNGGFSIFSFCCKPHLRISEPSDILGFQSKQATVVKGYVSVDLSRAKASKTSSQMCKT